MNSFILLCVAIVLLIAFAVFVVNFILKYQKTKVKCKHCGSERLRFYELSSVVYGGAEINYSVYVCAECNKKIYKNNGQSKVN